MCWSCDEVHVPSEESHQLLPGSSVPACHNADCLDHHRVLGWGNLPVGTLAKRTWSRTCDPPTLPVLGKMSACVTDGRRPIQADAVFFGGPSMFLRRSVISDSSQPSCRRLRFGFFSHEMTVGPHVIWGMSVYAPMIRSDHSVGADYPAKAGSAFSVFTARRSLGVTRPGGREQSDSFNEPWGKPTS